MRKTTIAKINIVKCLRKYYFAKMSHNALLEGHWFTKIYVHKILCSWGTPEMVGTSSMPLISWLWTYFQIFMKVFTRESLSGVTFLNLTFMKKQKKKISKINKTLKNDNKTLNMNIATSIFLLLDQVVALPSVFFEKTSNRFQYTALSNSLWRFEKYVTIKKVSS